MRSDTHEASIMTDNISWRQFRESEGVADWRNLSDGACAKFRTGSFAAAARFVAAISELPGVEEKPPEVDVRPDGVTVQLATITATYHGMSQRDVELARLISAVARAQGLLAAPAAVQSLLVIPGVADGVDIQPFWQAVLGYEARADGDLLDPQHRGPSFWIEPLQAAHPGGLGTMHVAVWVPYEEAEARIAAVLAAGGRMVRDENAPAWWTVADAAGNEADIATTMGRD
jgi:4a-hydroxytetrahydrobiopterin dehydratase